MDNKAINLLQAIYLCANITPDGSLQQHLHSLNKSSLISTSEPPVVAGKTDVNALMYIVVVLMFYAVSMTLLMVKYIKQEKEEALLDHYYNEFVKRDTFNNLKFVSDKRTAKRNLILKFEEDERQRSSVDDVLLPNIKNIMKSFQEGQRSIVEGVAKSEVRKVKVEQGECSYLLDKTPSSVKSIKSVQLHSIESETQLNLKNIRFIDSIDSIADDAIHSDVNDVKSKIERNIKLQKKDTVVKSDKSYIKLSTGDTAEL